MSAVPQLIRAVVEQAAWTVDSVDAFVFQANRFMLEHVARRAKLPRSRPVIALEEFGNTSCASIPLAMSTAVGDSLRTSTRRLVLAGFGLGFSWAPQR